jgi:hypothetical protein
MASALEDVAPRGDARVDAGRVRAAVDLGEADVDRSAHGRANTVGRRTGGLALTVHDPGDQLAAEADDRLSAAVDQVDGDAGLCGPHDGAAAGIHTGGHG